MPTVDNAYILHVRPYRETSSLIEALTLEHGLVPLVGRGMKRLQQFTLQRISWVGKSELVTLTQAEPLGIAANLENKALICGLYLNELLVKLLHKWDENQSIFNAYKQVILDLSTSYVTEFSAILRKFEKQLLQALGYAWHLDNLEPDGFYNFDPAIGPSICAARQTGAISGQALIALHNNDFSNLELNKELKQLMRIIFSHYLGNKKILSRELF